LTICCLVWILVLATGCEPREKGPVKKDSGDSPDSGFGFEVDKLQVVKNPDSWLQSAKERKIFQEYEKHFYPAHELTPNERRDYALSQFENLKAQKEAEKQHGSLWNWREEVAKEQKKMMDAEK